MRARASTRARDTQHPNPVSGPPLALVPPLPEPLPPCAYGLMVCHVLVLVTRGYDSVVGVQ